MNLGWNPASTPPKANGDYIVLLKKNIHGRRVFPATYDVRPYGGWFVSLDEACDAASCEVEEHRFDWNRHIEGWLPLPGIDGIPQLAITSPSS
jgi:hypothetical protein